MKDRNPPHNIEAEQGILGCILLDPRTALTSVRSVADGGGFFYDLRNQIIFKACCDLDDDRKPIDMISVQEKLRQMGELEKITLPYLIGLPDATPSSANLAYYLEIVEEKASLRRLIRTCTEAVANAYEDEIDVETIISKAEQGILNVRKQKKAQTPPIKEIVREALEHIETIYTSKGAIGGIPTGLIDIDRATDGMHPEEMIVIAGFPGSGKSALAMNIVEHVSLEQGMAVGAFSLEMSAKRLVMRMIASRGKINMRSVRDGFLAERDMQNLTLAATKLAGSNIHFSDLSDLTISQVRAKARQFVQEHDVKLFVIDYLQLLTAPGKKDQNREQEVSAISRGIKLMACEFRVPVLVLSQLNEDGKLRESRAIGQDADSVWRLKAKEGESEGSIVTMQLEILKQRDGEAPKTIDLTFFKAYTRFESAVREIPVYDK